MSQTVITLEQLRSYWKDSECPGARFGLLNHIESGRVTFKAVQAGEELREYLQFLAEIVRTASDDNDGAKALQMLLKSIVELTWFAGNGNVIETMKLLLLPWVAALTAVQPLSRLTREFLTEYQNRSIWPALINQNRWIPQLDLWMKAAFAVGQLDLFDRFAYVGKDELDEPIRILTECMAHARTLEIKNLPPSIQYPSMWDLSSVARGYNAFNAKESAARVKILFLLKVARGDFDPKKKSQ